MWFKKKKIFLNSWKIPEKKIFLGNRLVGWCFMAYQPRWVI